MLIRRILLVVLPLEHTLTESVITNFLTTHKLLRPENPGCSFHKLRAFPHLVNGAARGPKLYNKP